MIISRAALLLVPLFLSCARGPTEDFAAIPGDPQTLLGGLKSYSSPDAVAAALGSRTWKVTEQSSLKPDDKRPSFNILSVVVVPYQDRGQRGELHLTFFNSRLMSSSFYPDDPGAYRASLGSFLAPEVRGGELLPTHLRVWHAVDYEGREYFLWGDERLLKQQNRWLMKYSWVPPNQPLQATASGRA